MGCEARRTDWTLGTCRQATDGRWKTPWAVWLENQACDIGPLKGL